MTSDDTTSADAPRITPLGPPYEPEVAEQLARMMPAGVEPIGLFRTFARNLPMATAMSRFRNVIPAWPNAGNG